MSLDRLAAVDDERVPGDVVRRGARRGRRRRPSGRAGLRSGRAECAGRARRRACRGRSWTSREGNQPGAIALTLIPCRAHFQARSRVNAITPPLLALYGSEFMISGGAPRSPATEAMFTILPPDPCSIIARPAACAKRKVPVRLTSIDLLPALERHLLRRGAPDGAGAVDEDVELADLGLRALDDRLHLRRVAHVAAARRSLRRRARLARSPPARSAPLSARRGRGSRPSRRGLPPSGARGRCRRR